jgi:mRNA interferase RelE/StbE
LTASKKKLKHKYRLFFLPDALEEWRDLDGSVQQILKKLLAKRLDNPHVPGGELHGALASCYKIKLNKQGVRLVYVVEDDKLIVMVLSVDRREDSAAYKSAVERLSAAASALSRPPGARPTVPGPRPSRKK